MGVGSLPGEPWAAAGGPFTHLIRTRFSGAAALQSAPRCLGGKSVRWREPVCGWIPERGSGLGLAPGSAPRDKWRPLTSSLTTIGHCCWRPGLQAERPAPATAQQKPSRAAAPSAPWPARPRRLCAEVGAALAAARDGGTGRGGGGSGESSQSGSNSPGGGRRAAWLAVPAGGLWQPRRAAPPLIVAALAEVTIGGCPAGPHCGTRAHRSGAQTMSSERGRGSRRSEPRADGLAVGAHPRPLPGGSRLPACTGRRPLPLGRPPTRARLTPLRVRSPSGTSVRQGARR